MTVRSWLLLGAVFGPGAAGLVWVVLSRWPWPRRMGGSLVALGSHACGWAVFWMAYRGDPPVWESLRPGLLGASLLVAGGLAVLLAATRVDSLGWAEATAAVVGLAAAAVAAGVAAVSSSLLTQGLFLPLATLGAGVAALAGGRRSWVGGLLGLAAADAAALAGLMLLVIRTGTVNAEAAGGLGVGPGLVLGAALVKAGALPGLGPWRLAATEGSGAPVAMAVRVQGVALGALVGLVVLDGAGSDALAATAGAAGLLCGAAALVARTPGGALSALTGAAAAVPFLALGLGGALGVRAFLLSFPAFLLGAGALFAAGWTDPLEARDSPPLRAGRWVGVPALLAAAGSLAALPGTGGHPGTALALDLAGVRGQTEPLHLLLTWGLLAGLAAAAIAAVALVRAARPPLAAAVPAALSAASLLYMGAQPVRLGLGWWVRIEAELGVPLLLPSGGAPPFPAGSGFDLAVALVPAAVVALLVGLAGRGVRPSPAAAFEPLLPSKPPRRAAPEAAEAPPRRARRRPARLGPSVAAFTRRLRARAERLLVGLAAAAVLEGVALVLAVYLVAEGARRGFL